MLVRISKDWDFPDIMRQTPNFNKKWEDIEFTTEDVKECDLLIVLNRPYLDIKVKAREIWLMSQESPVDIYKWHTKSFKYFDKVFSFWNKNYGKNITSTQTALPWHIGKSYNELKTLDVKNHSKKDKISWVTSNATHKPGHKLRMDFKNFLQDQDVDFDLYGRGFNPINDKFNGIFPYKYSIAIENDVTDDYWTEKISDCFLSYTIPIYYGANKIENYFPKNSMLLLNPEKPEEALQIIKQAIEDNYWEQNFDALEEARNLVLEKYQLFPWVKNLLKQYDIENKKLKYYYIPANIPNKKENILKNTKNTIKANLRNILSV